MKKNESKPKVRKSIKEARKRKSIRKVKNKHTKTFKLFQNM